MKLLWEIIFFAAPLGLIKCEEDTELLLVQIIFRHGDRAPIQLYPTDPNSADNWPEGLGKLTKLGKKQQYSLGKLLRYMYRDFVTSSPNEVTVESSSFDRCLRSAQANVAAFYAPTPEWSFVPELNWQPIPVHYLPEDQDKYLNPGSFCPAYDAEMKKVMQSSEVRQFFKEYNETLGYLSTHSGEPLQDVPIENILIFLDTLLIEQKYNLTIPSWAYTYWDTFVDIYHQAYGFLSNSPNLPRFLAGPILGKTVEDMNRKIAGEIPKLKVRIHSTHDVIILAVLKALKFSNVEPPPYCATVIFELHRRATGENVVRLLYLNSTTPEEVFQKPHRLTLEGCTEYCPLEHFFEYTKDTIPENWEEECQLKEDSTTPEYGVLQD